MHSQRDPNSDFRDYLLLHPSKRRHERLANLISKNRATNDPETMRSSREEVNWEKIDQNQEFLKLMGQKEQKQKAREQLQMRQTKFMHSYMQRLKKQRKRQERKKFLSNPPKLENPPKKQATSMYIFLPIVSKHAQSDKGDKGEGMGMGKNGITTITTIDLFGDRKNRFKKSRAYSLDQKYHKLVNEEELKSYELKVQEVIQDIKNHRQNKSYKIQVINIDDQRLFQQAFVQSKLPVTASKTNKKIDKNEQSEKKAEGKKNSRQSRMITLTSKKLEPWIIRPDHMDNDLAPENVGIESFQFR